MTQQTQSQAAASNSMGTAGFIVSLLGIVTVGILFPIGMILSFLGLFKRPRGLAIAGFIIGLVGTLVIAVILAIFFTVGFAVFNFAKPLVVTEKAMGVARADIADVTTGGIMPDDFVGQSRINSVKDGWGHTLRYHRTSSGSYELRSAGHDGVFDTGDDDVNYYP